MSFRQTELDHQTILTLVVGLFLTSLVGVVLDFLPLVFLPLGMLFVYLLLYNLEWPFLLLFLMLPLSWEQEFSNGFGTDLPTEPLMVFLLGAGIVFYIRHIREISAMVLLHPIALLLLFHYGWMWISTMFSQQVFVSIKFSLAKTWYIGTFFFVAILLLRRDGLFRKILKAVLIPLVLVTGLILFRHYQEGFSFESANFVMAPFFRNHVNSAAMMSVFLPFVIYLLVTTKKFLPRSFYFVSVLILIAGIFFSYTRAAHLSVLISLAIIPVFHFRLTKVSIGAALVVLAVMVSSMTEKNHYLDYAPDFETTISHSNFEDLVSATYEGKDISTMERVYRWVAAFHMFQTRPLMGYGPGNFYSFYKSYTVTNFQTYVSDNPEKSGVHCYYLMVLVEQGLVGLIIFGLLLAYVLLKLENLYHQTRNRKETKRIIALAMSFVIIILFQLINDLIETDKVGSFFFLIMAMVLVTDLRNKGKEIISAKPLAG